MTGVQTCALPISFTGPPFETTSFVPKPVKLKIKVALSATLVRVNIPCALVVTPRFVPLIVTLTPSSGTFLASDTLPVMVEGGGLRADSLCSTRPALAGIAKDPTSNTKHTRCSMRVRGTALKAFGFFFIMARIGFDE